MVDNASNLASQLGVSTFLVGVIVVGFGTSAPELFVSAVAALQDRGNLALGNALGSNITNIGLVLGSAALVRALPVSSATAKIDLPLVIVSGVLAIVFVLDGLLSRSDGLILLVVLLAYLLWTAKSSNDGNDESAIENLSDKPDQANSGQLESPENKSLTKNTVLTIVSIVVLMAASRMLVTGSVDIAEFFGVGELIIGLTIVAIGTSLPELAAAIAAARKGVHDMIIGNIIGSNVFNTLGVLGVTGTLKATEIDTSALARDFPIMFIFSAVMLVFALTKGMFSRFDGGVLVVGYLAYLGYLVFISV